MIGPLERGFSPSMPLDIAGERAADSPHFGFQNVAVRSAVVQRARASSGHDAKGDLRQGMMATDPHRAAEGGFAGGGEPLPYRNVIERSFGVGHDLSSVRAYVGGRAANASRAIGAVAYARGEQVAFSRRPDLRLAAHEAAHVVQQRHGISLPGGMSADGDIYERAADAVADRVVAGASAADLVGARRSGAPSVAVQRKTPEQDEADRAVNAMWADVNDINQVGATVDFTFFTSNGGMTLTGFKRTAVGSGAAASANKSDFDALFEKNLTTFVGTTQRYMSITLKRTQSSWVFQAWGTATSTGPAVPPEAHLTAIAGSPGWRFGVEAQALLKPWIPVMAAYAGGPSTIHFTVTYEGDKPIKMDLTPGVGNTNQGKGPTFVPADPVGTPVMLQNVILSFSGGLGTRTVKLSLEGNVEGGATHWHLVEAATDQRGAQLFAKKLISISPSEPERIQIVGAGVTTRRLAEELYGDDTLTDKISVNWDETKDGVLTVDTEIPTGRWARVTYSSLQPSLKASYDKSMTIASRSSWGARAPITNDPKRSYEPYTGKLEDILDSVVVHHAGNSNMHTMKEVQDEQLDKKEAADINYHYGIDLTGNAFEGRPIDVKGAHVAGANTGKIGIVLLADLDTEKSFDYNGDDSLTPAMESTLLRLIHYLMGKYPKIKFLGGHKEFAAAQGDERSCPGDLTMVKMDSWRASTSLIKPTK